MVTSNSYNNNHGGGSMKVQLKFEYEQNYFNPFVVSAFDDKGEYLDCSVSSISFEEAKKELMGRLKEKYDRVPPDVIPEAEEVEL